MPEMEGTYPVIAKIPYSPRSIKARLKGPLVAAYAAAGRHGLGVNINVLSTREMIRSRPVCLPDLRPFFCKSLCVERQVGLVDYLPREL